MFAAAFWGSLQSVCVGASVTGCLRWGHGCGCLNVVGCITLDPCVCTAPAPCLFESAPAGSRNEACAPVCVCVCVMQGAEGSSQSDCDRTAGWFLLGNWWRQRSCHTAATAS